MTSLPQALFWIAVYLAMVCAPLAVLLVIPEFPRRSFVWTLSMAVGFSGATMMAIQFALTARFKRATAPYGIDVIYYFHRYVAVVAFAVVLAHPLLLVGSDTANLAYFDVRFAPLHVSAGVVSVVLLAVIVVTSLGRKRLGIHYDGWRYAHVVLSIAALALALYHIENVGYYVSARRMREFWHVVVFVWIALVLWVRIVRPLLVMARPYRVAQLRRERGDAWIMTLEPDGHDGLRFQPGQFVWLSLHSLPLAFRDHPFSIASSAARRDRLELTIKELGDFTRTIGKTTVGERAWVDGPYGAFTVDRYDPPGFVFVAGGIGIAPIMSMLRTLTDRRDDRPVHLFYAYRRWERMTLREEIETLANRPNVHATLVLEEPPDGWNGERGRIDTDMLARHLPSDRCDFEYFICGPEPMIQSVERSLRDLGVPIARYHSELFDLV